MKQLWCLQICVLPADQVFQGTLTLMLPVCENQRNDADTSPEKLSLSTHTLSLTKPKGSKDSVFRDARSTLMHTDVNQTS